MGNECPESVIRNIKLTVILRLTTLAGDIINQIK